jgi:hypothetical protein
VKAAQLVKTLILVGIVLALTLPRSVYNAYWGSFVLVAATLVIVPWTIYSLVRMAIRPAERRSRGIRLAIWVTALVVAFGGRAHWDTTAREEANTAVSAVKAYKGRTGAYPYSMGEVGIDAQALKEEFSLSYRVHDGKAYLFYSQPSMPLVAHHYNFGTNSWDRLD